MVESKTCRNPKCENGIKNIYDDTKYKRGWYSEDDYCDCEKRCGRCGKLKDPRRFVPMLKNNSCCRPPLYASTIFR